MYLDSAIIIKLSIKEPDSEFYVSLVDGRTDLVASALSLPECRSALARKVHEGEITQNEYAESCEAVTGAKPLATNDKIMRKAADELQIELTRLPR